MDEVMVKYIEEYLDTASIILNPNLNGNELEIHLIRIRFFKSL